LRIVPQDWRNWQNSSAALDRALPGTRIDKGELARAAAKLLLAFQDYAVVLREIVERYVPALLVISVYLLYEQLTPSSRTVTSLAIELSKVALWMLLGPALIISLTTVAMGYQKAAQKVQTGLRGLIDASLQLSEDSDPTGVLLKARDDVLWTRSPGEFVLSIIKSATLSIPFLLTVTIYVLKSIKDPEGWVNIFVPHVVVNFFEGLFR
jgi:hypothetical protein